MPSLLAQFSEDDNFLDRVASSPPELETNLNRLEQAPEDALALEQSYRRTHRINASAAIINFMGLSQLAHAMEDVLGDALDEVLLLDKTALSLLHRSLERLRLLIEMLKAGNRDDEHIIAEDAADHAAFRRQRLP